MTGEQPPSSGGQGGRRRRPPTIDLQATEVAQPEPTPSDPPQKADDPFIPPPPVTPQQSAQEPPSQEPSSGQPPPQEPPSRASVEPPEPPPGETRRQEHQGSAPRRLGFLPEELSWAQAGAGLAGAAGGTLVVLLLWLVGAFSSGRAPSHDPGPQLAAIEAQLRELAARPAPPTVDPKAVDDIAERVGRLEGAAAAPRAPVTDPVVLGRLSATENAVKSLADNVAGLSRRSEGIEAALARRSESVEAALRDTQGRIDKLVASLADLQTTARAAAAGSDRAVRLAVASAALREAVERGSPFVGELSVVKPLTTDSAVLAQLEPFATSGVPSPAALAQELTARLQPMMRTAGEPPPEGGFLERLQANAEKLVRIRPIDEARGDDRGAILTRIQQRAARADIPGALAEIAKLPPEARAPLAEWIAKAEARGKAIETSRRFAADAVTALKAVP